LRASERKFSLRRVRMSKTEADVKYLHKDQPNDFNIILCNVLSELRSKSKSSRSRSVSDRS
jgi:hypothetical protein